MTRAFFRDIIKSCGLSDNQALNRLQDVGAISDLCMSVEEIAVADLERAVDVLCAEN